MNTVVVVFQVIKMTKTYGRVGNRTQDLSHAKRTLYQLSYTPRCEKYSCRLIASGQMSGSCARRRLGFTKVMCYMCSHKYFKPNGVHISCI